LTRQADEFSVRRLRRQASYNRLAAWYDLLAGRSEQSLAKKALRMLDLRRGERVLEIGPGTGHALKWLAEQVDGNGLVCGLDLSKAMLRQSRRTLDQAGRNGWVGLVNADALQLPFSGGTFETVFMSFTLELFENDEIKQLLGECKRILKVGGRLCVVSLVEMERESWMERVYGQAHARFPKLVDCHPVRVEESMEKNGFVVQQKRQWKLWGLGVEGVVALAPFSSPLLSASR
jgi:ubiquinone/menaquinone biosynthesis C-methylase UbiE